MVRRGVARRRRILREPGGDTAFAPWPPREDTPPRSGGKEAAKRRVEINKIRVPAKGSFVPDPTGLDPGLDTVFPLPVLIRVGGLR